MTADVIPFRRGRPSNSDLSARLRAVEQHRDELLISRAVAAQERLSAAEQEHRYVLGALRALASPQPDVDAAERLLTAALRLVVREATRAAADIEPGPEPFEAEVAA